MKQNRHCQRTYFFLKCHG